MEKEKHILVLSLGTGKQRSSSSGVAAYAAYLSLEQAYRTATYLMQDRPKEEAREYLLVAQPIAGTEKADEIVFVGTVRSAWWAVYKQFADKTSFDVFRDLCEKTGHLGLSSTEQELEAFNEELNDIFSDTRFSKEFKDTPVRVILTRYGINKEELSYNYQRLKTELEKSLSPDCVNHISFDITHSFRSMPLYNLVLLNYWKNVTKYQIEIDHVYYGNLEVGQENSGISPIVDLGELVSVIDASGAVREFISSGSAKTLLSLLPDDALGIRKNLEALDWAVQSNNLLAMQDSLLSLLKSLTAETAVSSRNHYADIYSMLRDQFRDHFPSIQDFEETEDLEEHPYAYGAVQLKIGKWIRDTNRYGQASVIAIEAMRSLLCPLYFRKEGKSLTLPSFQDKETRFFVEEFFLPQAKKAMGPGSTVGRVFTLKEKAKPYRNTFAHNLSRPGLSAETPADRKSIEAQRVDDLYAALDELEKKLHNLQDFAKESGLSALKKADKKTPEKKAGQTPPEKTKQKITIADKAPKKTLKGQKYTFFITEKKQKSFSGYLREGGKTLPGTATLPFRLIPAWEELKQDPSRFVGHHFHVSVDGTGQVQGKTNYNVSLSEEECSRLAALKRSEKKDRPVSEK